MNWARPLQHGPAIPMAPEHFRGTLRRYLQEHLTPALPEPSVAIAWHRAVLEHASRETTVFPVRWMSGHPRGDEFTTPSGRRMLMTDNAPPWWMHAVAFSGVMPPAGGLTSIIDQVWCTIMDTDKGRKAIPGQANAAGWYIAHILQVKPPWDGPLETWDEQTARRRFLRNLSPLNQFLVPKGNGADIGERAVVVATVAAWYRQRYGEVFEKFLLEAGARPGEMGVPDPEIVVTMEGGKSLSRHLPLARRSPPARPAIAGRPSTPWRQLLEHSAGENPRVVILMAAPDAASRLRHLTEDLSVEGYVGLSNALFNKCDPRKLREAAPGNQAAQARLAWAHLQDAKESPRLGGKWSTCVEVLRPGSNEGLSAVAGLGLEDFVRSALRVVSLVYRKIP